MQREEQGREREDQRAPSHAGDHERAAPDCLQRCAVGRELRHQRHHEQEAQKQRNLAAPQRNLRGDKRKAQRGRERISLDRSAHEEQGERKQAIGADDAHVVHAAGDDASEHEDACRQHRGRERPVLATAVKDDGPRADEKMREDERVEGEERGRRVDEGPKEEWQREDQRLRVGGARVPGVVIGVPERRRA